MNLPTKDSIDDFNFVHVHVHIKCLIVSIQNKNTLYEFNEADKMIRDLRVYLDEPRLEHIKVYLEANCTKVNFTKASDEPEQLSLF